MGVIGNYGELKTALSTYMFHQRFVPQYDIATGNFEASINRRLSVRPMEVSTTLTTTGGSVPLPADYMLWRTLLYKGRTPYVELEYVHPAYLESTNAGRAGTGAQIFTIEAGTLKVRSIDDAPDIYEFHYFQTIPTITGNDRNTNWLLSEHQDAYLYGVLVELMALGRNVEGATLYKQRRDEVLQEIISEYGDGVGATSPAVRQDEYF